MFIKTKVLDEKLNLVLQAKTEINAEALVDIAASREELALSKGAKWFSGAITFFALELISLTKLGTIGEPLNKAAIELALVVWVFDTVFCGLDAATFMQSDLEFTMLNDGTVKYNRVAADTTFATIH